MAKAKGKETGKDRTSIKVERVTSRGRFRKGSLTFGEVMQATEPT
ncbi:unnamed protein product [marine sediment metagenome]|uniref:Uncharacterized protein n=1 Tax=marine sediment metagenome TaxID=412755 RepID=X1HDE5_9ZZZZ